MGTSFANLPQPFNALHMLLKAEETDSERIRTSKLGWWVDFRRIKGSAIGRIWRAVLVVTIWSVIVAVGEFIYGKQLGLTNNVTPLLSVVTGLLLVFRNGSAYARWDDGRKTFSSMISTARSLSRLIWINVIPSPTSKNSTEDIESSATVDNLSPNDHKAKEVALRLTVAFVVATKHHLRNEYGTNYEDLETILPARFQEIARTTGFGYGAPEDNVSATPTELTSTQVDSQQPITGAMLRASERDSLLNRHRPLQSGYTEEASYQSTHSIVLMNDYLSKPSLALPLIIAHQLNLYLALCKKRGLLESVGPAGYNAMTASVSSLVQDYTMVERLSRIGIPTVYGVHLKQCVSLFLFTLPFTLVEIMGWKMIPFVTVTAFTLMGIEGIASEIEMPFGVDDSDLPLDLMCAELRNEIEHTIARLSCTIQDWMM